LVVNRELERGFFQRLRHLDDEARTSFAEIGRILITVEKNLLHECVTDPDTGHPCSFTRWVKLAAPYSHAYCFKAKRVIEALSDVPAPLLATVLPCNFDTLTKLSTATRNDPKVLEAASNSFSDAFVEFVKREHPEQHIEAVTRKVFVLTETQAAEVKEALEMAMREFETNNASEALAGICIDYRASLMLRGCSV
jgi:hypothetical protein